MTAAGFSLIELLIALTVCALLSGAIASATPPARALFDATPELLDQQQRERTVSDVLTRVLRSAAYLAATRDDGTAGEVAPAVELLEPDQDGVRFHALRVLVLSGAGRGVLATGQASPASALSLRSDATCPSLDDVCGFSKNMAAAIVDVDGHVDVFVVSSVNKGASSLTPAHALNRAYAAGSALFAVSADTYYLDADADGTWTLVRKTAAGAVQPIVDAVSALEFQPVRRAGVLTRLDMFVHVGTRSTSSRQPAATRVRRLSVSLRSPS